VSAWQPIETAPKDADVILTDGRRVSQGGWLSEIDQGADYEGMGGCPPAGWWSVEGIDEPTHWMPLPSPPK
jgi:hypothetical protein